jgi:hypothetical protein
VVFRPREAGSRVVTLQNVAGSLIGIDRRPADGKLYGLTGSDVYRVDPEAGEATLVSTLTIPFDGDVRSGVDFTPQLDRLRLTSADGRNLRVNVAIGATAADTPLAYASGDPNAGARPRITASGYGNNKAGVATTTLFEIDSGLDVLVIQDPGERRDAQDHRPDRRRRSGGRRHGRRDGRGGQGPRLGRLGDDPLCARPGQRPGDCGRADSRRDAPRHLPRDPRRSALSHPHPSRSATRRMGTG